MTTQHNDEHTPTRKGTALIIVVIALLLSVFFFCPHLWLFRHPVRGSFEWDRAITYLKQCSEPFRSDIEPAMRWRLLPPLVAKGLRMKGYTPLILPWSGIMCFVAYVAIVSLRRVETPLIGATITVIVATTSAVVFPLAFLGINDAWVWLGLVVVAFGRSERIACLSCLLCPWIDERFIIGFPVAWLVRIIDDSGAVWPRYAVLPISLLPYAVIRLLCGGTPAADAVSVSFLRQSVREFPNYASLIPLGWWMGLRAGWLLIVYAVIAEARKKSVALLLIGLLCISASAVLAADASRSIAVLIPVVMLGCFRLVERVPMLAKHALVSVAVASLMIPAAHVIHTKIYPISPLPIELVRLARSSWR